MNESPETHSPDPTPHDAASMGRSQRGLGRLFRGSSLLLAGRMLSKVINLGVQIAIVRLLTKDDFGAFAYGLALALSGELVVKLGLGRGANRFVPYYAERGDRAELMGTLALVTGTIVVMGGLCFAALWSIAGLGWMGFPAGEGGRVVLILSVLAPIQALDTICIQTLACFSQPRAIFLRKHVLGPGLRVVAVALVFVAGGRSEMLAVAYVAGGVLGLWVCLRLSWQELFSHGVLPLPIAQWRVPWRPLFRFSIPMISSDLAFIVLTGVSTVVLMATHGEEGVASMRAVVPAAALNAIVIQSFSILFMPGAMRLHAQHDDRGLRDQHWQSAIWVAVLSFPIFALTFGVAPGVVPLLFGQDYAESAPLLALLAVGHYVGVCLGFNSEILQVFERTRALVWTNLISVVLGVVLLLSLCPVYGALGAATAVTVARVAASAARHFVLMRMPDFESVPRAQTFIWLKIAFATGFIAVFGWVWQLPLWGQILVVVVASFGLLRSTAHELDIARSFPELAKIPLFARLVGA
jgi:O-antigen/teichoic acid export membrane protein